MRRADGIVYVNLSCINPVNSGRNIPVVFTQQSSLNLIDDISRYNMGVVRFSVPTGLIPVNVIPQDNAKVGNTGYSVSMEINATTVNIDVPFSSDVITSADNVDYYSYYSKFELLRQVNIALDNAYTAMVGIDGSLPAYPPIIIYNTTTKLYELWTPQDAVKRPNPISIYLNTSLSALFDLPAITDTYSDVLNSKIIIQDTAWNVRFTEADIVKGVNNPYYVSFSERETAYAPSFQKLILVSNNGLNTASEYVQSPQSAVNSNNPTTTSANILTDFEVDFTSNNSGFLQFQSSGVGNVRLIDFLGTGHIQSFSINMYYQLFNNNVFPLAIRPGESASLKVCFIPKSYFISNTDWN